MKEREAPFLAVMYHYVRPKKNSNLRYLDFTHFERQLDFFENKYGIISRDEWQSFSDGGDLPEGVLLTFDDGLKDHITFVAPELSRRNLFGLFYVNTDPLVGKALSVHLAHYLLAHIEPVEVLSSLLKGLGDMPNYLDEISLSAYQKQDHTDVEKTVKRIVNWAVNLDPNHRALVEEIFGQLTGMETNEFCQIWNLTENEITLLERDFEVGSHTKSHRLLSRLNVAEQFIELSESKEILRNISGGKIQSFCFPYGGRESYTDETLEVLRQCEYTTAISVESENITSASDFFELPRFDCNEFLQV